MFYLTLYSLNYFIHITCYLKLKIALKSILEPRLKMALYFRQQTICLIFKNGLKSILVRRFLDTFSAELQIYQISQDFLKNHKIYINYI